MSTEFQKRTRRVFEDLEGFGNPKSGETGWMIVQDKIEREGRKDIENTLIRILSSIIVEPDHIKFLSSDKLDKTLLVLLSLDYPDPIVKYLFKYLANEELLLHCGKNHKVRVDLHSRVLQGLCYLKINMPLSFWKKQVEMYPQEYLPSAFAGVRMAHSFDKALELLEDVDLYETELAAQIYNEFRGWIRLKGSGITEDNFEDKWKELKNKYNIKFK